jgi:hypothetical protein
MLQAALAIGARLLNQYYDLTDMSNVYRIATSKCFPLNLIAQSNTTILSSFTSILQARLPREGRMAC